MKPVPRVVIDLVVGDLHRFRAENVSGLARVQANLVPGPFGLPPSEKDKAATVLMYSQVLELYDHLIATAQGLVLEEGKEEAAAGPSG